MQILFIGNSFTARHDLPTMVTRLAASRGLELDCELISVGGASLRRHWNAGKAAARIRHGGWDSVVLQEQSTLPIKNAKRMHENIRLFADVIRERGARCCLYETWARAHAPETQAALTEAYGQIASELGATVVPVGQAWKQALSLPDSPELYDNDGSHPSLAGSYLAACCLVAVLLRTSPLGLPSLAVAPEQAKSLQESAARSVSSG